MSRDEWTHTTIYISRTLRYIEKGRDIHGQTGGCQDVLLDVTRQIVETHGTRHTAWASVLASRPSDWLAGRLDSVSWAIQVGQQLVIWESVKQMEKTCIVKARAIVRWAQVLWQQPEAWQNTPGLWLQGQSQPALNQTPTPSTQCETVGLWLKGFWDAFRWVIDYRASVVIKESKTFVLASDTPFLPFFVASRWH